MIVSFLSSNVPIALNENFFGKTIKTILIYLLACMIVQNSKNYLKQINDHVMMYHFWVQNGPFVWRPNPICLKICHLPDDQAIYLKILLKKTINNIFMYLLLGIFQGI